MISYYYMPETIHFLWICICTFSKRRIYNKFLGVRSCLGVQKKKKKICLRLLIKFQALSCLIKILSQVDDGSEVLNYILDKL